MLLPPAFRSLARAPALAIGVVVTLALGVAALTTAFGVVNAGLWRQPPFRDAHIGTPSQERLRLADR